jgi:hypothetical protein
MSISDDIIRMAHSARRMGPATVLKVSQDRYEWLKSKVTIEDTTWVPWSAVFGVQVIIDPELTGMDFLIVVPEAEVK